MRVTFRAQFQGRKGALSTGGFKFPNPPVETIEVFRRSASWFARVVGAGEFPPRLIDKQPTYGCMKDLISANFDKQVSEWQMFGPDEAPLDPKRVEEDPKGNFTLKDMTHVGITGPGAQGKSGANYFNTVCGIEVHVKQLRSARGSHAPDCQPCREAWEKTKPEDRLK